MTPISVNLFHWPSRAFVLKYYINPWYFKFLIKVVVSLCPLVILFVLDLQGKQSDLGSNFSV